MWAYGPVAGTGIGARRLVGLLDRRCICNILQQSIWTIGSFSPILLRRSLTPRTKRSQNDEDDALTLPGNDGTGLRTLRDRLTNVLAVSAFVYLSSIIVVMASERAYWFWAGLDFESVFILGAFYLIPAGAGLWAVALTPAKRSYQVVLAGAIFAFVVEGVLTPIIYGDGPLPIMAAMFVGWHGLISFVGFWYLTRTWLVNGETGRLSIVAAAFGSLWGVWAVVSAMADPPDAAEIGFDATLLAPGGFARYALAVGATFAVAHWLIGYVWPVGWRPSKISTWAIAVIAGGYMVVAVLPAVLWAPIKLAALIGGTWWLISLSRKQVPQDEPSIIDKLNGHPRLRHIAPVMLMSLTAALTYTGTWAVRGYEELMGGVYWMLVGAQITVGAGAFIWAGRRAAGRDKRRRSREQSRVDMAPTERHTA